MYSTAQAWNNKTNNVCYMKFKTTTPLFFCQIDFTDKGVMISETWEATKPKTEDTSG